MSQTDAKIKYAKEEIELRVESLKCELDLLNDNLQAKLDNLKSKLTKLVILYFWISIFKQFVKQMKKHSRDCNRKAWTNFSRLQGNS